MRSDGRPLPDVAQTGVLRDLGLLRTDELPDVASRWLAVDLIDSENIRELAGTAKSDTWTIDGLLAAAINEARPEMHHSAGDRRQIALDWVVGHWRLDHDTKSAIKTLARLGENDPGLDLDFFIGLDDELQDDWGRSEQELIAEAAAEFNRLS